MVENVLYPIIKIEKLTCNVGKVCCLYLDDILAQFPNKTIGNFPKAFTYSLDICGLVRVTTFKFGITTLTKVGMLAF